MDQGRLEFQRMCFGLKGRPATFQRLMNRVLTIINGIKTFVYLENVIIVDTPLDDHQNQLKEVLARLRKFNLKLQPIECVYLRKEVSYLVHIITDPNTTDNVVKFSVRRNSMDVKSFLRLAGHYKDLYISLVRFQNQ